MSVGLGKTALFEQAYPSANSEDVQLQSPPSQYQCVSSH